MNDKNLFKWHKAAEGITYKGYKALQRKVRRKRLKKLKRLG